MNNMDTYRVTVNYDNIPKGSSVPALLDFEESILSVLESGEETETYTVFDVAERRVYAAAAFTPQGAIKDYIDRIYGKVEGYYKGAAWYEAYMSEYITIKQIPDEWEILED